MNEDSYYLPGKPQLNGNLRWGGVRGVKRSILRTFWG